MSDQFADAQLAIDDSGAASLQVVGKNRHSPGMKNGLKWNYALHQRIRP